MSAVNLTESQMRSIQESSGLSARSVHSMLLAKYAATALDLSRLELNDSGGSATWSARAWVTVLHSNACPMCLRTDDVWKVSWKLPWFFACATHARFLVSSCDACGGRLPHTLMSDPLTRAGETRGGKALTCRYAAGDLTGLRATVQVQELQFRVSRLVHATGAAAGPARARLRELRSLTVLALEMAGSSALTDADELLRTALHDHASRRGVRDAAGRHPTQASVPHDPVTFAAALLVAERLADTPDSDLVNAWEVFVASVFSDAGSAKAARWHRRLGRRDVEPRHRDGLEAAFARRKFGSKVILDGRARPVPRPVRHLSSAHVPALFWREQSDPFLQLLSPSRERTIRQFLSVALARTLEPGLSSWEVATPALHLPAAVAGHCRRLSGRLRRSSNSPVFEMEMDRVVQWLAMQAVPVDYASRRQVLATIGSLDARSGGPS